MDDDGGLSMRHWPYYEPQLRGNLGLQLMSSTVDRDRKPLHSNGPFIRRDVGVPGPPVPMNFVKDGWIHQSSENPKLIHMLSVNHQQQQQQQQANYSVIPDPPAAHTVQMLHHPEQPKNDKAPATEKPNGGNEAPLKKRSQGRPPNLQKTPKPKKPRKAAAPKAESSNVSASRRTGTGSRKSTGVIINGISYDLSQIPTPVCTCTGSPQQCYRWGVGGWQSACCTNSVSVYPLPLNTKRRGARIAGRKMSQGAFTKVLEKLAVEDGYNLSNPIDLKPYWAKHGTNKFVTIR